MEIYIFTTGFWIFLFNVLSVLFIIGALVAGVFYGVYRLMTWLNPEGSSNADEGSSNADRERAEDLADTAVGERHNVGMYAYVADAAVAALTDAIARTREEQNADIERLQGALRQAADWFDEYAVSHHAEGADEKSYRNATRALHCRQAADLERE